MSRVGNRYGDNPSYKNIEVRMTREGFMSWAVPAFEERLVD
jgi:hypothetical protein